MYKLGITWSWNYTFLHSSEPSKAVNVAQSIGQHNAKPEKSHFWWPQVPYLQILVNFLGRSFKSITK